MFNNNDTFRDVVICPVKVKLITGELLSGVIEKPRTNSLEDFLNAEAKFLAIELYDLTKIMLSRSAILFCQEQNQPKVDQLKLKTIKTDILNPFCVLGLEPGANREAVRKAYVKMTRQYHPDRYEGLELPKEIASYVLAMTQRLNLAFEEANEFLDEQERKTDHKMSVWGAKEEA